MNKLKSLQAAERHLAVVSKELNSLLALWDRQSLPDDFLAGDSYPFESSLDEVAADVDASLQALRDRLAQPMAYCSVLACQAHFAVAANPPYSVIHREEVRDGEKVVLHLHAITREELEEI